MKPTTLFPVTPENGIPTRKKKKYKQSKLAKQRYNLTHRARLAGVKVDAKTRSIEVDSIQQADPLTRRRINKLMKHGFGGELKINFPE